MKDDPPGRENPEGLLAEIRARLLNRPPSGDLQVLDVQARYFVSDDRAEEAWSVQTAVRDLRGGKPGLYTETGTRSGRTMTVIINAPGEAPRSIKPTVPPEGYLSQVEVFMLPRLLAAAGMEGDVGFYAYVSAGEAVSLRQDHVSKTDRGWVIRSRQRDRDEPQELTYDVAGHLLGGTLSDGSVLEPTTAEAILKRWQDLGLPAGSMEKRGK